MHTTDAKSETVTDITKKSNRFFNGTKIDAFKIDNSNVKEGIQSGENNMMMIDSKRMMISEKKELLSPTHLKDGAMNSDKIINTSNERQHYDVKYGRTFSEIKHREEIKPMSNKRMRLDTFGISSLQTDESDEKKCMLTDILQRG